MKKKYPEPFKRAGNPHYYFTVEVSGKRRNLSTGQKTKEKARDSIREYIDERTAGTSSALFAEYAKPFFLWEKDKDRPTCPHARRILDEGKSIGRTHLYQCSRLLDRHILRDETFSNLSVRKVRRRDILELRDRLREGGVRINTANKAIAAVKIILAEAFFRGDIDDDPGAGVGEVKYQKAERGVLLPTEVSGILGFLAARTSRLRLAASMATPIKPGAEHARASLAATQAVRDQALVALLLATGLRSGELRALRWGSIDMNTGRAKITEALKGADGIGLPKWGKVREIVVPRVALDPLKAWRSSLPFEPLGEHFIFGYLDKQPLGYEGAHNVFETILRETRKDEVLPKEDTRWLTPHAARHSLNTNLLAAGVSPLLVQSFLGWTSTESKILTRVQAAYTHLKLLRIEEVAEAIDRIYAPSQQLESATRVG